jgi:hypothetical protein
MTALRFGTVYFLIVFACAFVTGVVRTLFVTPALGPTLAVMAEVPLIIAVSWLVARWMVLRTVPMRRAALAMAGMIAFALLMAAEAALAKALTGQSPAQWAASLFVVPGLIGLAGQLVFALMPLIVGGVRRSGPRAKV